METPTPMSEKHTPTPWEVISDPFLGRAIVAEGANGEKAMSCDVATIADDTDEANAAFIVRAVNAHDDLVAALQEACDAWADQLAEDISACCPHFEGTRPGVYDGEPDESRMDPISKPTIEATRALISRLTAALAKARKPS